jgi:hypothetical protein
MDSTYYYKSCYVNASAYVNSVTTYPHPMFMSIYFRGCHNNGSEHRHAHWLYKPDAKTAFNALLEEGTYSFFCHWPPPQHIWNYDISTYYATCMQRETQPTMQPVPYPRCNPMPANHTMYNKPFWHYERNLFMSEDPVAMRSMVLKG